MTTTQMTTAPDIETGEIVRVYWNLHKDVFSVQRDTEDGWRVRHHVNDVRLENVTFMVSAAGRDRARREGRRNVHAFVQGMWAPDQLGFGVPVCYNPFRSDTFMAVGEPIEHAEYVHGFITYNQRPRIEAIFWD